MDTGPPSLAGHWWGQGWCRPSGAALQILQMTRTCGGSARPLPTAHPGQDIPGLRNSIATTEHRGGPDVHGPACSVHWSGGLQWKGIVQERSGVLKLLHLPTPESPRSKKTRQPPTLTTLPCSLLNRQLHRDRARSVLTRGCKCCRGALGAIGVMEPCWQSAGARRHCWTPLTLDNRSRSPCNECTGPYSSGDSCP